MTASIVLSTPIAPLALDGRYIDMLSQISVIVLDAVGASVPSGVVMEHHEFDVDNICSRTSTRLLEG